MTPSVQKPPFNPVFPQADAVVAAYGTVAPSSEDKLNATKVVSLMRQASASQIEAIANIMGGNARPVQAINNRLIIKGK